MRNAIRGAGAALMALVTLAGMSCASQGVRFPFPGSMANFRMLDPAGLQRDLGRGDIRPGTPLDSTRPVLLHCYTSRHSGLSYRFIEDTGDSAAGMITGVQFTTIALGCTSHDVGFREAGLFGLSVGQPASRCAVLGPVVQTTRAEVAGHALACSLHVPDPDNENLFTQCCTESGKIAFLEYRLSE